MHCHGLDSPTALGWHRLILSELCPLLQGAQPPLLDKKQWRSFMSSQPHVLKGTGVSWHIHSLKSVHYSGHILNFMLLNFIASYVLMT